jgi:hypothetical protein
MSKHDHRETLGRALLDAADPCNLEPAMPGPAPDSAGALVPRPDGGAPAIVDPPDDASPTPYIDANGFDPAEYRWVPVRRRPRVDGFSEAKQRRFIETLADTGSVETAAREIGMSVQSCYRLRRSPGAEPFAAAWDAAVQQGALKLVDIAFDRAIHGSDEPVFDRNGNRVGRRMKPSDRLLMFLLRAHLPDRYRHAHQSVRQPDEPPARVSTPIAQAIATLEPVTPPDPHLLMSPERLDGEVQVADMCDGELPRWYDPAERPAPPPQPIAAPLRLEGDLEHQLAQVERAVLEALGEETASKPASDTAGPKPKPRRKKPL